MNNQRRFQDRNEVNTQSIRYSWFCRFRFNTFAICYLLSEIEACYIWYSQPPSCSAFELLVRKNLGAVVCQGQLLLRDLTNFNEGAYQNQLLQNKNRSQLKWAESSHSQPPRCFAQDPLLRKILVWQDDKERGLLERTFTKSLTKINLY